MSGTSRYTEEDSKRSRAAFSAVRMMPLWQEAFAIACLGAVIGCCSFTLLSEVLAPTLLILSQYTAWGAVCGAILLMSVGVRRLGMMRCMKAYRSISSFNRLGTRTGNFALPAPIAYHCQTSVSWFTTAFSTKLPNARTVKPWIASSPSASQIVRTNHTSCGPISSAPVWSNW